MSSPTDELFTYTEGYFLTKSLLALWRLGLLDKAANEGVLVPDEIARELGLDRRLLRAVLDYLVVRGIFVVDDGTFRLSDQGKRLAPYYGYLPMHVGAYEPIFGSFERVLRGELVYGENLRRAEHELVGGMSSMEDALLARLAEVMSEIPFRGVLDMGCGSGRMLSQLLRSSTLRGVGVDRTVEACEKARRNLAADGLADRTTILHGDASRLGDLPAGVLEEVDLVIAMFVMHEIHWQQSRSGVIACLRDISRIIGSHGRFVMVEVSRAAGDRARPGLRFIPEYQLVHEFSQQRLAGEDEWREMLDEAGLEVLRTEPAGMCEAFCFVIANRQAATGLKEFYQETARNAAEGEPMCCPPCAPERFGAHAYSPHTLAGIPQGAIDASMAWGDPVARAEPWPGEVVLDLGCGAGLDLLLAAREVGPAGRVVGVDLVEEMLSLARTYAEQAGAHNVELRLGAIERLPLLDGEVDVVIANGTVSLAEDKRALFAEVFRVLRPGGRIAFADFVLRDGLDEARRGQAREQAGCTGALAASEYARELRRAGFLNPTVSLDVSVGADMYLGMLTATKAPAA